MTKLRQTLRTAGRPRRDRARVARIAPMRSLRVAARYAVAITPAMAELIDPADPADPIARQFVPDVRELEPTPAERADPIGDDAHSPVTGIVHRYPDRALLKLAHLCAVYCRFCFRREMVGPAGAPLTDAELDAALAYIARAPGDLGGDPHRRRSAYALAAPPRATSRRSSARSPT